MRGPHIRSSGSVAALFVFTMLAPALFFGALPASAETVSEIDLISCTPNFPLAAAHTFAISRGQPVSFTCTLRNTGTTASSILLVGKQVKEGDTNPLNNAVSSSVVQIGAGKSAEAVVGFPVFFRGGTYRFVLSLQDVTSGKPVGKPLSYVGALGEQKFHITEARLDANTYDAGDTVRMTLAVAPLGAAAVAGTSLLFDVATERQDWTVCSSIAQDQAVHFGESTYRVTLPKNDPCAVYALRITLKTKDGTAVDNAHVLISVRKNPISLQTNQPIPKGPFLNWLAPVLLGLAVLAYALRRREQRQ